MRNQTRKNDTPGQRKAIYLDALELLTGAHKSFQNDYNRYACHAIQSAGFRDHLDVNESTFPEICAFAHCGIHAETAWLTERNDLGATTGMYSSTDEGNEFRQLVLIFAAELCDDRDFINK
jgi:hypothetical protein